MSPMRPKFGFGKTERPSMVNTERAVIKSKYSGFIGHGCVLLLELLWGILENVIQKIDQK